ASSIVDRLSKRMCWERRYFWMRHDSIASRFTFRSRQTRSTGRWRSALSRRKVHSLPTVHILRVKLVLISWFRLIIEPTDWMHGLHAVAITMVLISFPRSLFLS